jgi:hypothetical protein
LERDPGHGRGPVPLEPAGAHRRPSGQVVQVQSRIGAVRYRRAHERYVRSIEQHSGVVGIAPEADLGMLDRARVGAVREGQPAPGAWCSARRAVSVRVIAGAVVLDLREDDRLSPLTLDQQGSVDREHRTGRDELDDGPRLRGERCAHRQGEVSGRVANDSRKQGTARRIGDGPAQRHLGRRATAAQNEHETHPQGANEATRLRFHDATPRLGPRVQPLQTCPDATGTRPGA